MDPRAFASSRSTVAAASSACISDRPAQAGNDVQLTMDLDVQRITEESLQQGHAGGRRPQEPEPEDALRDVQGDGWRGCRSRRARRFGRRDVVGAVVRRHEVHRRHPRRGVQAPQLAEEQLSVARPGAPGSVRARIDVEAVHVDRRARGRHGHTRRGDPGPGLRRVREPAAEVQERRRRSATVPSRSRTAIAVSSDVYFYIQGFRFWKLFSTRDEKPGNLAKGYAIQRVAREFGFSKPTGIGLGSELRGRIPDEKFKLKLNKQQPRPVLARLAARRQRGARGRSGRPPRHADADGGGVRRVRERRDALRAARRVEDPVPGWRDDPARPSSAGGREGHGQARDPRRDHGGPDRRGIAGWHRHRRSRVLRLRRHPGRGKTGHGRGVRQAGHVGVHDDLQPGSRRRPTSRST